MGSRRSRKRSPSPPEENEAADSSRRRRICSFKADVQALFQKVESSGLDFDQVIQLNAPDSYKSKCQPSAGSSGQSFDPMGDISEPSALTSYEIWKRYQYNCLKTPRWKCYRGPPEAEPHLPLSLLHESFEIFCKMNAGPSPDVDYDEARQLWLRHESVEAFEASLRKNLDKSDSRLGLGDEDFELAEKIWDKFTAGCEDEAKDITEPLNDEFIIYLQVAIARDTASNTTDGFSRYGISEGSLGIEDKREGEDALFQLSEYFRQSFRTNARRRARLSHALGVVRSLPYIQFLAVVMDWQSSDPAKMEGTLMVEPLTDMINCWGPKDLGLVRIARALKAMKYFVQKYHPESFIDTSCPYLLNGWVNVKSLSSKLSQERMVFLGTDADGNTRVAKFTSNYSRDAHVAWAKLNFAPALHEFMELASGWKFIVMDYLSEDKGWRSAVDVCKDYRYNQPALRRIKDAMINVLRKGHQAGFVHGDFRLPNIFLKEEEEKGKITLSIMVIDFDWSGPLEKATYPHPLNGKHAWHREAAVGRLIKPEHDYEFVNALV